MMRFATKNHEVAQRICEDHGLVATTPNMSMEYLAMEEYADWREEFREANNQPAPAPLPPPQEPRKQYLNPQQRAKWERRLEAGMDKSEDFPECTPDQRAVLWTLLELKQSERELAAAESRIAQLEQELKERK